MLLPILFIREFADLTSRLCACGLIDLNRVLLLEPVFRHVLSNHVLRTVLLEWVQMVK